MGILIVIGSITLYKTFALYKEEKTFNVIRGQVPKFSTNDLELTMTMDGKPVTEVPSRGAYDVQVQCDDTNVKAYWDDVAWGPVIQNVTQIKTKCSIQFSKQSKKFSQ